MSIPASEIVQVIPGVINAGGSALDLNGLILSDDAAVPVGTVYRFANARDVQRYFGLASKEARLASIYFNGFDTATRRSSSLLFAQFARSDVAAYLRSGSLAAMTVDTLKTLSGTLEVTIDGVTKKSANIDFSSVTSFSNAAANIQAAFNNFGATCIFDPQHSAFVIMSATTGVDSTVNFATGTLAKSLNFTEKTGAVISAGSNSDTPITAMTRITDITRNWASFMTTWEPDIEGKLAFSDWTNSQRDRYVYVGWDTDVTATQQNSTTTWAARVAEREYSGSVAIWRDIEHAAFVLGSIAAIDFRRLNGRITLAFKGQSGLAFSVTDATTAKTLIANGYNFYGDYATSNDAFRFFHPGQISGRWQWIDTYANQIWLNAAFEQALMTLLTQVNAIPYNTDGYTLIEAACIDPIHAAVNFGAIRPGVTLSSQQKAHINSQAGIDISDTLFERGWYLQIKDAAPQVRQARETPPMTFWYMDGGSIQQITLASLAVI